MADEIDEGENEDLDANAKFYGFEEDTGDVEIPEHLPVLALRGVVIFPSAIVPLPISRKPSLELVEEVLAGDRLLALVAQKDADEETPSPHSIHRRGTVGRLLKMLKYPDQSVRILVQGIRRVDVVDLEQETPYFSGRILPVDDTYGPEDELAAALIFGASGSVISRVIVDGVDT